jgi:aminoglycoside phosphotransferase (APT) family kinase protein
VRPDLADASFTLHTEGWDSTAVEAHDTIFKFPKRPEAIPRLRKEARLLALIRPRVTLAVPDMRLHETATVFSEHPMIPGGMIETPQYDVLTEGQRQTMAEALAGFYASLHAIPVADAVAAGAEPNPGWPPSDDVMRLAVERLPPDLHDFARRALAAYEALAPRETTFCYCDGHGWNMAFDHARGVLNGLYDFADAGLGPAAKDLGYSNFISSDLTERLIAAYEVRTGRPIDRREVALHTAVQRLAELDAGQKEAAWFVHNVVDWARYMQSRADLAV